MLIWIAFIGAIGLYLSAIFLKKGRWVGITVWGLIFVVSTAGVTMNYSHHWGMKKVTTTHTQQIYSAASARHLPINLYQPVGTSGEDNVYLYNTQQNQKKPSHTQANERTFSSDHVTSKNTAHMVITEQRWRYQNNFYKLLFMGNGMDGKLAHRTNRLYYPRYYVKVSVKQMKSLQKSLGKQNSPAAQQALRQQMTAYVQQKVAQAQTQDPQKIKQITAEAQSEFQANLLKKALHQ